MGEPRSIVTFFTASKLGGAHLRRVRGTELLPVQPRPRITDASVT